MRGTLERGSLPIHGAVVFVGAYRITAKARLDLTF